MPRRTPAVSLLALLVTGVLLLSGCAARMAYRDGKALVASDQVELGLDKFQQALAQDPGNPEYRQAVLQTRERAAYTYLELADRQAAAGRKPEADKLYQRVLAIDPANERARTGLRTLDMQARHAQALTEARAALDKKDIATARARLRPVLNEDPANAGALALQQAIADLVQPAPVTALSKAYQKPISIEFKDVSLKQVFEVIARTSGLNFLFDKDVRTDQKTSIFLKNSTIESAVHFTLLTNQLEQHVLDANTILIYPNTAAKQRDYQELMVRTFFLTNADAKVVANTLKTILKSRDIVVDEKLNMLILRDNPEAIRIAEKLVALHDVAEPEVMLEVEILEVKRTRLLELGIQWPNSLSLTPLPLGGSFGGGLTLQDLRNQNSNTLGAGIGPVTLKARKEDADAKLLANPRIRTRNREKARILIGERVPNITTTATSTGFVSESINYVDVGLTLNVEPTIYLDNDVAIKVQMEVSNIVSQLRTQSGTVAYQIGTRTASTVLRLKDGETQVLAGLINDEDRRSGNKVPGIGELPILGRLFGSGVDDSQKTEIVLSITPHLIRNIQRPDAALAEFRSGTDNSFRSRPDSIIAPSPAPVANARTTQAVPAVPAVPADLVPPAGGVQVQWQGPTELKVGETFALQLLMQSDQPVTSLPMALSYDSAALQVISVGEGGFLKQGGGQATFTSRIDAGGQILLSGTRSGESGASAPGEVATITFKALAASPAARVQLLTSAPVGLAGKALPAAVGPAFQVLVK
ncbi:type IV pilus secretin PilQ [Actimicrobium antarcticum]|uniref:Tetratricopeptide repeat protein n=1 Tax=Actimicrobium antarcticum TaxID=1051899 RepID=A0ABP7TSR1_9BURK